MSVQSMSDLPTGDRFEKAQMIASNPLEYQVCEGCESIVGSGTILCPNCHGYRFDGDPIRVVDQAQTSAAAYAKTCNHE